MNMFTKLFIVFSAATVGFLSLAVYAGNKVVQNEPELISKIQTKYNVTINKDGVLKGEATQDSWTFAMPAKKVTFKSYAGNIIIKKSLGNGVKITATGQLDKSKSPRLLETDLNSDELVIREPDNNSVGNLEVQIELPAAFGNQLEILTVSGDVTLKDLNIQDIKIGAVSGDVILTEVNSNKLVIKTVSGDVSAQIVSETPVNSELVSVSGDIKLKFSKTDNTKFLLNTLSGDIQNPHPSAKAAAYSVNVSTTSGDIEIE